METLARTLETEGMKAAAEAYATQPNRAQLPRKDQRSWREFYDFLITHSALGSALTARGVQLKRPTIYDLEPKLRELTVPTFIMVGDEDDGCIEPGLFMKRTIRRSGLAVFPQSGHVINLEEPALFNRTVLDFLTAVEAGAWV
jgi:pimeloyl-ACP methyl ester carboxylesterase